MDARIIKWFMFIFFSSILFLSAIFTEGGYKAIPGLIIFLILAYSILRFGEKI